MPFKKGQSGNPGGRPKGVHTIQELARQHSEEAIKALAGKLKDKSGPTVVAAAVALLDRAWGKPGQTLDVNHNGLVAAARDEALLAIAFAGSGVGAAPEEDTPGPDELVH